MANRNGNKVEEVQAQPLKPAQTGSLLPRAMRPKERLFQAVKTVVQALTGLGLVAVPENLIFDMQRHRVLTRREVSRLLGVTKPNVKITTPAPGRKGPPKKKKPRTPKKVAAKVEAKLEQLKTSSPAVLPTKAKTRAKAA